MIVVYLFLGVLENICMALKSLDAFFRTKLSNEMGVDLQYVYSRINNTTNNTQIWTKIMNMVSDYLSFGKHGNTP